MVQPRPFPPINIRMFYHSTDFDFSSTAKQWILARYAYRFADHFYHDLDANQFSYKSQQQWTNSAAGKELLAFLAGYNLDSSYYGITAFISNASTWFLGNPHIDVKYDVCMREHPIRSRFNVLVQGNSADKMYWWDHMHWGDSRLSRSQFRDLYNRAYTSISIPGDSVDARWQYLGTSSISQAHVLTPSAFIKTDCVHTVNVSPGPRLIVTVAFDKTIEKIIGP
jgi:hypothetical protein